MPTLLRLVLLAAAIAPLPAQAITPFGSDCGTRGTVLEAYGAPTPGQVLEAGVRDGAPDAFHFLLVGFSSTSWAGTPLPWPVPAALGFAPGCELLVSLDIAGPLLVGAAGTGSLAIQLPAGSAGTFYLQVLGLPLGEPWYTTNALDVGVAPSAPATVTGSVRRAVTSAPIAGARVTLFTPALAVFAETRSDAAGSYSLPSCPASSASGAPRAASTTSRTSSCCRRAAATATSC